MNRNLSGFASGSRFATGILALVFLTAALSAQRVSSRTASGIPARPWPPPNVLVILADDIGWRDIDPSIPTPNIDSLARDGVSFRRAYSMPYCSPTRFSLLFGLQGFREQLGFFIDPNLPGEVTVGEDRLALPQALKAMGYRTLCAGKWHLSTFAIGSPAAFDWPRRFGFDAFRAGRIGNIGGGITYSSWPRIDDGVQAVSTEYNTTAIRRATSEWWAETTKPKFAYVAFHAAHAPFHVPPAELLPPGYVVGTSNRSRFEAMIVAMDTEIGRLLEGVDRERTFVFFIGDNGTPSDAAAPGQDPSRLKGSVYEGGINVPLIVSGPGVARGQTSGSLISVTDLFATVLDLVTFPVPAAVTRDSVSFAQLLAEPERSSRNWVYSQFFTPNGPGPKTRNQRAVITRDHKLITDDSREFLFNLVQDPEELRPIAPAAHPALYRSLRTMMDSMVAQGAP